MLIVIIIQMKMNMWTLFYAITSSVMDGSNLKQTAAVRLVCCSNRAVAKSKQLRKKLNALSAYIRIGKILQD
ncbi:MAG: hypothetical protein SRB2_02928 [Desulfobacteraceae bacterium Eth-SRB2]|nr:MAG: hypothetical protein SRB2_02928 [Desulfobacteraceae bacterium Eth-SRB2]